MRIPTLFAALVLLISLAAPFAAVSQTSKKKVASTASPSKAQSSAKPARKTPARRTTARRTATRRRAPARRAAAPVQQRSPSQERYAEIQQALADAGYFSGPVDGRWQEESIDALKAFQDFHGFEASGRIDSRSLIKLGLGPSYETSSSVESETADAREPE